MPWHLQVVRASGFVLLVAAGLCWAGIPASGQDGQPSAELECVAPQVAAGSGYAEGEQAPTEILAPTEENSSEPGGRRIAEIYGSGLSAERIDLFNGTLHLDYVDVRLPGKNGLNLEISRWYASKRNTLSWGFSPSCNNTDYAEPGYNEVGEVLGYGWRFHMGRFYPFTGTWNGLNELPPQVLELPGGKTIAFYAIQTTSSLLPGEYPPNIAPEIYPTRWLSPDNWMAFIPEAPNSPLYVFAPDGRRYTFGSEFVTTWNGQTMWSCTQISLGGDITAPSAAITISYKPFSQYDYGDRYPYISEVNDSFGRTVALTYATDASDTNDLIMIPS